MKTSQQDKVKAAKVIAMSLDYTDLDGKNDPTLIINSALRKMRNRPLNKEAKAILVRMLGLATNLGVRYDETLVSHLKEEVTVTDIKTVIPVHGDRKQSVYSRIRKMHMKLHEAEEFSDDELYADVTEDDIIEHCYEDDEFVFIDENGEESGIMVTEVLSRAARMRSKMHLKKSAAKRGRAERIALKKKSSTGVIAKRARRLAVKTLEKRLAKKPLDTLSVSEKERLEKRIASMKPTISRLAVRLMPKVRGFEQERLSRR